MEIVNTTHEGILKQFFPKIFHYFGPMTSSLPLKKALFEHFEQIIADFGFLLDYNKEVTT